MPIGIVHIINKKNFEKIGPVDIEKFRSLQNLIGMSIDLTSETHSVVNVRIGVQKALENMQGILKEELQLGLDVAPLNLRKLGQRD